MRCASTLSHDARWPVTAMTHLVCVGVLTLLATAAIHTLPPAITKPPHGVGTNWHGCCRVGACRAALGICSYRKSHFARHAQASRPPSCTDGSTSLTLAYVFCTTKNRLPLFLCTDRPQQIQEVYVFSLERELGGREVTSSH